MCVCVCVCMGVGGAVGVGMCAFLEPTIFFPINAFFEISKILHRKEETNTVHSSIN